MIKVLAVFTTSFLVTGGHTSVMMNYWREINNSDIMIDFVSSNPIAQQLSDEITKKGSHYHQLPPRKHVFSYFMALKRICRNYDIIHIHSNSATAAIELVAAKIAGVKIRISHNHTSKTQYPFLNKILHPLFLFTVTDAIACSKEAGDWLYGKKKYKILPNAINVDKYRYNVLNRKKIRSEFNIQDDVFVIGHIGKFMNAKNHEFIIKVFCQYKLKNIKTKLVLVGDGELRPRIEDLVNKSGYKDSIILTGMRSDVCSLLQAFDVFIFPSIYEGLPLSVLEAQTSGLPCIISSNISNTVNIGVDVVMKPLSAGVEAWASEIDKFDYSMSRDIRSTQNYNLITEAHFNIKNESNELLKIYYKKVYNQIL